MRKTVVRLTQNLPLARKYLLELRQLRVDKGVLQLEKGNLEAQVRSDEQIIHSKRTFLARHYLRGNGIEIGAAQLPVVLPPTAKAKYVDVFTDEDLRKALPKDYAKLDIVRVDIVDDGEKLTKFKNGSLDFIIANHFIEHCLDPISTIMNMYKKLRKNGVLYLAIPDKRYTFDKPRQLTTYEHLLEEHQDTTKTKFLKTHTVDFVRYGETEYKDVDRRVTELLESGYRVHYHVWTQKEMIEMFLRTIEDFSLKLEVEVVMNNHHEVIFILRKEGVTNAPKTAPRM